MTKQLCEIDMTKFAKPVTEKVSKKRAKKPPVVEVTNVAKVLPSNPIADQKEVEKVVEEHQTTGGKTPATLELIKETLKVKKPPTEKQIAARLAAKEKREAKKKEELEAAAFILAENTRKENEAAALAEAKLLKRKEKAAERKKLKEAEQAEFEKPIDQSPARPVAVSIKTEGRKMYKVPELQVFRPSTVEQPRRVGAWSVVGSNKRLR